MALDYVSVTGPDWGAIRVIIDGADVTNFRGVPIQVGELSWQDPYVWGPAQFRLPQVGGAEQWGIGDLTWLDNGKTVQVVQVDEAGAFVRLMWKGFVHQPTNDMDDTSDWTDLPCDGFISGRLALREWHGPTHDPRKDVGRHIFDALRYCRIPTRPILGVETDMVTKVRYGPSKYLELVDNLLTIAPREGDGHALTIGADAQGRATIEYRDTTVAGKVFYGAPGVHLTAGRDLSEEWTSGFARTKSKKGELQRNLKHPMRMNGDPEPPPSDLLPMSEGDENWAVELMKRRLVALGFLEREDAYNEVNGVFQAGSYNNFNRATTHAVKRFQRRGGLPRTGVVNTATWNKMYDLKVGRRKRRRSYVAPLWELDETRRWNYTATGVPEDPNPLYDRHRIEVDLTVEVPKPKRWAARWLETWGEKIHADPPFVGTLTLKTDMLPAGWVHGPTTSSDIVSLMDAGMIVGQSVEVANYQGTGKTFHVAYASLSPADRTVVMDIDTAGRDWRDVLNIIEKRQENRPEQHSRLHAKRGRGIGRGHGKHADEHAGWLADKRKMGADRWNVIELDWGEWTTARRISIELTNAKCEFAAALFNEKVTSAQARKWLGNPFADERWALKGKAADLIDDDALLWASGTSVQPGGYSPGFKTGRDDEPTGDPITGKLKRGGSIPLHLHGRPNREKSPDQLYLVIWPKRACTALPQRMIYPMLNDND